MPPSGHSGACLGLCLCVEEGRQRNERKESGRGEFEAHAFMASLLRLATGFCLIGADVFLCLFLYLRPAKGREMEGGRWRLRP